MSELDFLHFAYYSKDLHREVNFYRLDHFEDGKGKIYSDLFPCLTNGDLVETRRHFNLNDQEGFEIVSAGTIKDCQTSFNLFNMLKANDLTQEIKGLHEKIESHCADFLKDKEDFNVYNVLLHDFVTCYKDNELYFLDSEDTEQSFYITKLMDFSIYLSNVADKISDLNDSKYKDICYSHFINDKELTSHQMMNLHNLALKNKDLVIYNAVCLYVDNKISSLNDFLVKSIQSSVFANSFNQNNLENSISEFLNNVIKKTCVDSFNLISQVLPSEEHFKEISKNSFSDKKLSELIENRFAKSFLCSSSVFKDFKKSDYVKNLDNLSQTDFVYELSKALQNNYKSLLSGNIDHFFTHVFSDITSNLKNQKHEEESTQKI